MDIEAKERQAANNDDSDNSLDEQEEVELMVLSQPAAQPDTQLAANDDDDSTEDSPSLRSVQHQDSADHESSPVVTFHTSSVGGSTEVSDVTMPLPGTPTSSPPSYAAVIAIRSPPPRYVADQASVDLEMQERIPPDVAAQGEVPAVCLAVDIPRPSTHLPSYSEVETETSFVDDVAEVRTPPSYTGRASPTTAVADSEDPPQYAEVAQCMGVNICPGPINARIQRLPQERRVKLRNFILIVSVLSFCTVMFLALFPASFIYVEHYEIGFLRTKSTGKVDTRTLYEPGCYVLGVDKEFVYLNQTVTRILMEDMEMFTFDNVAVSISFSLFYIINPERAGQLWDDYAGKHHEVVVRMVQSTVRNCAPRVSQFDYLNNRSYVSWLLHNALHQKFNGTAIEPRFFDLLKVHLPQKILDQRIHRLILRVETDTELFIRAQKLERLETEKKALPIIYEAKETLNNASAQAAAIIMGAEASKDAYLTAVRSEAMKNMKSVLNVTQEQHLLSFYYLSTLNTMRNYKGVVDYSKQSVFGTN